MRIEHTDPETGYRIWGAAEVRNGLPERRPYRYNQDGAEREQAAREFARAAHQLALAGLGRERAADERQRPG
jgi:hypothetical protein